ncbi:MAG: aminoglycoside 6-adenylyltransferase [Trueperaceae bacterium]|nr:aminoglycoside 6-adenylyltransferase [Trueperaceae bacterium]
MTLQDPKSVLANLINWAEQEKAIRAVLLTSNRANPKASTDKYSDFDVVLVAEDIHTYFDKRDWLTVFGKVLVTYWDDIYRSATYGSELVGSVIQYEDTRIDFTLWPVELLCKIVEARQLPDDLDVGYKVLLDKDGIAKDLQPPTFSVYIPKPPGNALFQKTVEDFLSVAPHLAKCLWRDELLPAKWCLDYDMKHNFLRVMLEWRVEIDHDWTLSAGALGKGLKKHVSTERWNQLEATYVGASMEENWEALLKTLELFREISLEVATSLGFSYPDVMHQGVVSYVSELRKQA